MFIRRKKNKSGTTSVVVVDKYRGRYKELHTVGITSDPDEIRTLEEEGRLWIDKYCGIMRIDFEEPIRKEEEMENALRFLGQIDSVLLNGAKLILDKVYNEIGFNQIKDETLRQLVVARLCQPLSKLATVDYLKRHFDEDVNLSKIYRYLDKLYNSQQELVQQISVKHTLKVLGGRVKMLFYDVTSLYFESFIENELKAPGFSKDGKTAETQIILGLLVSENGYPLAYSIFNGAQYESYTMIPVIDDFIQRFKVEEFVVIADSGFMIKRNIDLLRKANYKYIVGARIKSLKGEISDWILSLPHDDGKCHEMVLPDGDRLIVSYSASRAKKDAHNRKKGIERLRKSFASGKITKDKINKRGYNKFLKIENDVTVSICEDKIKEDAKWDGLKGYTTNTTVKKEEVISQYRGLWVVEKAFRVSKNNLETRPIFHFTERRIEAHVCLCFVAYKVYKELERIIDLLGLGISVDKVLTIAKTITTISVKLPLNKQTLSKTMLLSPEHRGLQPLLDYLGV